MFIYRIVMAYLDGTGRRLAFVILGKYIDIEVYIQSITKNFVHFVTSTDCYQN